MSLTPDQRADRVAARQHSLITREQALACGLTVRQIDRRVLRKRWLVLAPGVYAMASAPKSWKQRALAAVLAGPPDTVVSHLTAAAVHGLTRAPSTPHVIVPRRASGRLRIARVHRIDLDPRDRLVAATIPTTSVARTLVDCASVLAQSRLCDVVDDAFCGRRSHPRAVVEAIERAQAAPGKKGLPAVRQVIEVWTPAIEPGSPAEVRLLRQIGAWGFEKPVSQFALVDADDAFIGRIDLAWPARGLGLEYDGERHHNPRHWARDEARHTRYRARGWEVLRVDKYDLLPGAAMLRDTLGRLLPRSAA